MGYFFISYANEDEKETLDLVKRLEDQAQKCWVAVRDSGNKFNEDISQAIKNSDGVILIVSDHSNESRYVPAELKIAIDSKKAIFPVFMPGSYPIDKIEIYIASLQRIKYDLAIDYLIKGKNTEKTLKKKLSWRYLIYFSAISSAIGAASLLYVGSSLVGAPPQNTSPVAEVNTAKLSCEEFRSNMAVNGRQNAVACNANTGAGFYWAVSAPRIRPYGYWGMLGTGAVPPCNSQEHVEREAETATFPSSVGMWEVREYWCRQTSQAGKCTGRTNEGPVFSSSSYWEGVFKAICRKQ